MIAFNRERLRRCVKVPLHALDQRWVHFLLIALFMASASIWIANWFRPAEQLDLVVQDYSFQMRGAQPASEVAEKLPQSRDIVILRAEHFVSRHVMAKLLDHLKEARVVLLDFALSDRESELLESERPFYEHEINDWRAEDKELSEAIARAGNVVIGTWMAEQARPDKNDPGMVVRKRGWQKPPKMIWEKARYRGHLDVESGPGDMVVRRVRLVDKIDGREIPCVDLAIAAAYLGIPELKLAQLRVTNGHLNLGQRRIPVGHHGSMLIDYLGDRDSFEKGVNCAAYQSVLSGLTEPSQFAGKIVIIGIASDQSRDMMETPFDRMPGMLVHANVIATLLSQKGPPALISEPVTSMVAVAACLLILIPFLFLPMWGVLIVAVAEAASIGGIAVLLFRESHVILAPSAAFMGIFFTVNTVGYYEYRRARQTLGRFVGQEMVPRALHLFGRLDLGGREVCASAFYCDVRGYSTLAEHMSPRDINALVNAYTTALVAVVRKHGGRPITYQGDGAFVLFEGSVGGIDHAERAVRAAIELQSRFVGLRRDRVSNGASPMKIGIGIETGQMFVGLMGATEHVHFNAVGDAVNVAARVQGLTEECGYGVLITRNTYELTKEVIYSVPCGSYMLKGREQTVEIFGVPHMGDESESKREQRDQQIQPQGDDSARFAVRHEPSGIRIDAVPHGSASGPRI